MILYRELSIKLLYSGVFVWGRYPRRDRGDWRFMAQFDTVAPAVDLSLCICMLPGSNAS